MNASINDENKCACAALITFMRPKNTFILYIFSYLFIYLFMWLVCMSSCEWQRIHSTRHYLPEHSRTRKAPSGGTEIRL